MKWNWKAKDESSYIAKLGDINLDVWSDKQGEWFAAFDLYNGKETATKYGSVYKTPQSAKKWCEKNAEAWIKKFQKSLKG